MIDIEALFARQAAWQRSRARLPWSEKLRQALVLREAQLALRDTSRLPHTAPRDAAGRKKNP